MGITRQADALSTASERFTAIGWVLVFVAALHGLMFIYDYLHPAVFFNADRALARWQTIQGLYQAWDADQLAPYLAGHGIPGDYLLQGMLLAWGGKHGLIFVQVSLALLAGFSVYRIGRLLSLAAGWAALASGVYLLLPHTLIFPHQLASEALYSPLLTLSLWLTIEAMASKDRYALCLGLLGAGLAGIATLIRPVTLLWPMLPVLALLSMKRRRPAFDFAFTAFLPIVAWASFMTWQTGDFGFGPSDHDMAHNLYQRTARVVETLPSAEQAEARARYLSPGEHGTLGVGAYLNFGLHYPAAFLLHSVRDSMVFFAKSGLERIPIDYLLLNQNARTSLQDADSGWRKRLETEGISAALSYLWRTQGAVLLLSLAGSIILLSILCLAIFGALRIRKMYFAQEQRAAILLLIALPLYVFVFSQVVDAMQSRHRAPAEAALVLLAVVGARELARRFQCGGVTAGQRLEVA